MRRGEKKRIPCSDWLHERVRWAHPVRSEFHALVQQEKNSLFGHIINLLLPSLFGKSGWLLASLFFVFLLASTLPRFIQTQKRPWQISSHLDHKLGQQRIYLDKGMISIIQWSKSCWQLTIFFFSPQVYPGLILNFLCLLALIIHGLRLGDKGHRESTYNRLNNFNLNLIQFDL